MWAAVVNRAGEVCAAAASKSDPTQVWPGSQAIAKAKAYTANAFSLDSLALSTARHRGLRHREPDATLQCSLLAPRGA